MLARYLLRRMSTLIGDVNECCEIPLSRNIDYKTTIVCDVTLYILVYIYRCFRETSLILLRVDDSLRSHHTTSTLYIFRCITSSHNSRSYITRSINRKWFVRNVHSVGQKPIDLKFSKSRTGSDVRYSCHHNSSRFTFPILAHSWRFSVIHSLQSITPRIY